MSLVALKGILIMKRCSQHGNSAIPCLNPVRPCKICHAVSSNLSLFVSLHIIARQRVLEDLDSILPLLALQDGDLAERVDACPQCILAQPDCPVDRILTER